MSGHVGRIGGRQVVAVLALGGGLLLGPVLPAQAGAGGAAGAGDAGAAPAPRGPAPAVPADAHGLTPVLPPALGRPGGPAGRTVRGAG
ncbi:hypothetical protein ABZ719_16125 [Streptomyces sp. NPDC006743]|uniref:hypothetical protein n=1 Tax=Streptomyces sp. NPDC006743 TaxID=3154480 RepID=UPI003451179D